MEARALKKHVRISPRKMKPIADLLEGKRKRSKRDPEVYTEKRRS